MIVFCVASHFPPSYEEGGTVRKGSLRCCFRMLFICYAFCSCFGAAVVPVSILVGYLANRLDQFLLRKLTEKRSDRRKFS